ncbi:sulfotransferase [Devosia sp. SL43]|uniref:sulfotransferase n=1 Tax=Devosia sp. SL43 TaxID=2806348 RepID=UPI001F198594|nr:sulfotransferase [Devosia sp. SL43]UJW85854.1 hypothetical protein IM737_00690 [Devosia sp. SL43]
MQEVDRKIFVLGDSRTGTLSLHNFFQNNGISSVHYFMAESNQTDPIHIGYEQNRANFFSFLESTDVRAFTDYPTRAYYKELHDIFPDAYFILTVRSSTEVWRTSMEKFLGKFNIPADLDRLSVGYETVNADIEKLFSDNRNFIKVVIDDGNEINEKLISDFLEISTLVPISNDNVTSDIDNRIWSKRYKVYGGRGHEALSILRSMTFGSKALLSEHGWCFLANDSNNFLEYLFGTRNWSSEESIKSLDIISKRITQLKQAGIIYQKYIVPEKAVVYREYLPRSVEALQISDLRPAFILAGHESGVVRYLYKEADDAKSLGQTYFKGDSHTNWLGAWAVYRQIAEGLGHDGLLQDRPIDLADLRPELASYDGDLFSQLPAQILSEWKRRWQFRLAQEAMETTIKYELRDGRRCAVAVPVPQQFDTWFTGRQTLAYERPDGRGLRAVIFRDSTADFFTDYLAQHFSRSVFIWQGGQIFDDVIEIERPDLVIHVMAERFVSHYPKFLPTTRNAAQTAP